MAVEKQDPSITYRTILTEAVRGYNNLQNTLVEKFTNTPIFNNIKKVEISGKTVINSVTADVIVENLNMIRSLKVSEIEIDPEITYDQTSISINFSFSSPNGYYYKTETNEKHELISEALIPIATEDDIENMFN